MMSVFSEQGGAVAGFVRSVLLPGMMAGLVFIASCGGNRTFETLYVSITSDVAVPVDSLSLWIIRGNGSERVVTPRDPDDFHRFSFDVIGVDLSKDPYTIQIKPGEKFVGVVKVVILGKSGAQVLARAVVEEDLSYQGEIKAVLSPLAPDCDKDVDGFPDCGVDGCCSEGEMFPDCDDQEARATPTGFEDDCTRCGFGDFLIGDSIDDDCSGAAAECRDSDEDLSKDCVPTWCLAESEGSPNCLVAAQSLDCDPDDPAVFPGALERCDYQDNDCNGIVDDNAPTTIVDWNGVIKGLGEVCGTGLCEQACDGNGCVPGVVECNTATGKARCSSEHMKADAEICGNGVDDDCNGLTDQEDGCDQNDLDGDGVEDTVEDEYCRDLAKYHSEIFPEHDPILRPKVPVSLVHPAPEPCCCQADHPNEGDCPELCDWNCDDQCQFCVPDDQDCDGYPAGQDTDCDDGNPAVHANAPEKCADGIDQDCKGGDAPCNEFDLDDDGYFDDLGDCDDSNPKVNPGTEEVCNGVDDDCNGYVDDGNPGGQDEPCGSDIGECSLGTMVCVFDAEKEPGELVGCENADDGGPEACDGMDNDCNGDTDENFHYDEESGTTCNDGMSDEPCGDWPVVGQTCAGIGECSLLVGEVECVAADAATCSTNPDGSIHQDKAEACDNLDNDCDGSTDEDLTDVNLSTCIDIGVCGGEGHQHIQAQCHAGEWSCSYMAVPGYEAGSEKLCDDLDNDCDGETDEDIPLYSDTVHPEPVPKGAGCGTGECANGKVVCSADHTGLVCDTSIQQDDEVCDGLDNDCNGLVDEDFSYLGTSLWIDPSDIGKGRSTCIGVGECGVTDGLVECISLDAVACSTNPDGSTPMDQEEFCDAKDNDCDGVTDEELTDVMDSTCLQAGVCLAGLDKISALCQAGQWFCDYTQVNEYEAAIEKSCDGLDNDCDATTDEDFQLTDWDGGKKSKGDGCGTGACGGGTVQCLADESDVVCSTASLIKPEVCNYQDDDCDGDTDENQDYDGVNVGDACTGVGNCGTWPGVVECHPVAEVAVCSTNPDGSDAKDGLEICDAKDNNCNGLTDKGLGIDSADCTCLKVGVCEPDKVVAVCPGGEWICDYGAIEDFESPVEATCDGKDNDCDGVTDESSEVICDDGIPCTQDLCQDGGCVNTLIPGHCLIEGTCYAEGTANLANQCKYCDTGESTSGWTDRKDGDTCNFDDDGCTEGDSCQQGYCLGGVLKDCMFLDDQCTQGQCNSTGVHSAECVAVAIKDNEPCDDGIDCTKGDQCQAGACGGTSYDCDDSLPCTVDTCDGNGGCEHAIKDGWCLIGPVNCVPAGTDRPGSFCEACITSKSKTQWSDKDAGTPCNDWDVCTEDESCQGGSCAGGNAKNCDDGNQCTLDDCLSSSGCTHTPSPGIDCNDQNDCTHTDVCGGDGTVCIGAAYTCSDTLTCTGDVCDGAGGCLYPIGTDWCVIGGLCIPRDAPDPTNGCRECNPDSDQMDWTPLENGTPCNDEDACTTDDACTAGNCQQGGVLDCDDGKACTTDGCQPAVGCFHIDNCPALNPKCTVDGCRCGTAECDDKSDRCTTDTCMCGAGPACGDGQQCCSETCEASGTC